MPEFDRQTRRSRQRHASRASATYASFIRDVAETGDFSIDDAADFAVAVVATLEERLTIEEALDLDAQLPTLLRELLDEEPIQELPRMDKEHFCARVGTRLALTEKEAEPIVSAVFSVLRERISAGEARHVEAQLPEELKEMWRKAPDVT
jgi:uncharacterized protein (DUF2267 family)